MQNFLNLQNKDTFDRVRKLPTIHDCKRRLVITYDEESSIEDEYGIIEIIPYWKWVLE